MAGYFIAQIDVTDPQAYEAYRAAVPAVIAKYGGRYLVRGGSAHVLEGELPMSRLVILAFDSIDRVRAFYESPEYQKILPLRLAASKGTVIIVEGIENTK
jgi:uncharacterized protein (DUF1330 family)